MATRRSGYFKTSYGGTMALLDTPWRRAALVLAVLAMLLLPRLAPDHIVFVLNHTFIAVMGALALNLLTGLAGQISLGHAAFMAVGAVASHYLAQRGLHFVLVVPLVMAIGAGLGALVGAPALRLRGLYLVVGTVGFHYVVAFFVNDYQSRGVDMLQALTGLVLPSPDFGLFVLDTPRDWYFALFLAMILVTLFCINVKRTRVGRAWVAIRDRDITAAALGVHVARYKVLAFAASSALTCMTGSLLAYFIGSVTTEYFSLTLAIAYLAMVVIGGGGTILGPYLGAVLISALPHLITGGFDLLGASPRTQMLYIVPTQVSIFGIGMVLFLMFEPRGLVGIWTRLRTYFELWPLRQSILSERRT